MGIASAGRPWTNGFEPPRITQQKTNQLANTEEKKEKEISSV
jgi:hypothetical protein